MYQLYIFLIMLYSYPRRDYDTVHTVIARVLDEHFSTNEQRQELIQYCDDLKEAIRNAPVAELADASDLKSED